MPAKMQSQVRLTTQGSLQVSQSQGTTLTFSPQPMPADFLRWQSEARVRLFQRLSLAPAESVRMHPAHLPVLATFGEGHFPANLTCKGLGVLPSSRQLTDRAECFEQARQETAGAPDRETLARRAEVALAFYSRPEGFDAFVLGGLEIFEGQTLRNLRRCPLASLLYTGEGPAYPSYQFDGVVEVLVPGNPYYRFLRAARELFALDPFHLPQKHYPCGYLFHVVAVRPKTPYPRG